ncbi:hypothetical protein TraAM80_04749 [Trypanosoma rangeli]|uniref:Telomere length regulation protein conserved domain-containing protein n=1 Tax=Trypanosoma rangeli TaxID=5698 RepID=A0A3R7MMH0_TRYRA|nr:uncharacterized protein TraAM80_04749 [Trypanosoma rangeli]RNF05177.1 hypothetical protein TraAM80_04749 [Trypanosoma rangeli]|eukprot:RNF05177.1 hypothetical protein TraAM80_04749 [Trypanosoma rangeli]
MESVSLYEGSKAALSKITRPDSADGIAQLSGKQSEEALEHLMDMLRLDAQPEVIICRSEDALVEAASSTPLVMLLCEFAVNLKNEELSPMETQILQTRCTFMASLPDRVANALLSTFGPTQSLEIDVDLLVTRMCQSLYRFLFALHEASPSETVHVPSSMKRYEFNKKNALLVCEVLLQSLIRRGFIRALFQSFISVLKVALYSVVPLEEIMILVFKAVYKCNFKNGELLRDSTRNRIPVNLKISPYWSDWNVWFLQAAERDNALKPLFISSLLRMINISIKNEETSSDTISISKALMKEIFVTATSYFPTERGVLRVIFRDILPRIVPQHSEGGEVTLSEIKETAFTELLKRWNNRDVIEKDSVKMNSTLANSVLYMLLDIKEHHVKGAKEHLPAVLLQPLLAGISARFEIVRADSLRNEAITVASAFATFFVGDDEARNAFSNLEQFPGLLDEWLKSEVDPMRSLQVPPVPHISTQQDAKSKGKLFLYRRSVDDEEYPLNPDSAFTFFCQKDFATVRPHATSNSGGTVVFNPDTIVDHAHLPSFGKTLNEQDELEENVTVLVTLRESYNAIMGVGRGSNVQAYEVQQAMESGLRGFARALKTLKDKLGVWKERKVNGELLRSREKIGRELNPMVAPLLTALMSLTIHAPEAQHKELMDLRYAVMVSLITIVPENALSQLGKMLYSSHYGIFQRVEMAKAIGEAAKYISQVEVRVDSEEATSCKGTAGNEQGMKKRIYPPIRKENVTPVSIIVAEGKKTRRWGNAVVERVDRKERIYCSYLTSVVSFFVGSLLEKAENDHFCFFREHDPYAPTEILRSIGTVIQCIASARHVAPALCENLMSFAIQVVTEHPVSIVRKQGWVLIGEIMRCWCGAGPLFPEEGYSFRSRSVFGGSLSYVFSQQWLNAQQALEVIVAKSKGDPSCMEVALLVLADLHDLFTAKQDLEVMEGRVLNTQVISIASDTKNRIRLV